MQPEPLSQETLGELKHQLVHFEAIRKLSNQIHAAKNLDEIFLDLNAEILAFFNATHLTIYAVDYEKKEIYSRFYYEPVPKVDEFRLPISDDSIAGFVAKHRILVNIANAYDDRELAKIASTLRFDRSWDQKTAIHTSQVLAAPLLYRGGLVTGVIQLLNKRGGERFDREDEERLKEVAETLGTAFYNHYQLAKTKPTKFDHLIAAGFITQAELDNSISEAREKQKEIESFLIEKHKVPKRELGKSLSAFYNCPFHEYDDRTFIQPDLIKSINLNYLKVHFWLPLRRWADAVEILIDDPTSFHKVQDIKRLFPAKQIKFQVALREDILKYISSCTASTESIGNRDSVSVILGELASDDAERVAEIVTPSISENDGAIVRLANQIIINAYRAGASDIHVEPYSDGRETEIRFRIDGVCKEYLKVPPHYRSALASRFKIMAQLDIAERRKPQDGKIRFRMADREIELRVATVPTAGENNEDIVMRLSASSEPMPLEKLRMSERNLTAFRQILDAPYGMILCVGPTGSGKTTTMHSALGYLNDPETKIWTAEDPVEITQYRLRQVQVQPRIGFDFAAAMRSFLRCDPDVIMIGEMRDRETAEMTIEASLTGHLVLSTLHTNNAVETITRLLEMGMDPFNFADALLGVLAQRLARTICEGCKEKYRPAREEYDELVRAYGEQAFAKLGTAYDKNFFLYRGKGCEACGNSGYRGRIALHELLVATEEFKRLIHKRVTVAELFSLAVNEGMTTLLQDGIAKTLAGWIDFKQVKAVAMK
jgi:type II secretory ATPase GspE/PulE/Tfp pilus assembly ATPase PilB-like protein